MMNETKSEAMNIAEERVKLAYHYVSLGERLAVIELEKPKKWLEIREEEDCKSDAKADKIWQMTELGIEENQIRSEMKRVEKLMSALKTKLEVLNMEARNQY